MIRYDIRWGISGKLGAYILIVLVTIVSCNDAYIYGTELMKYHMITEMPGVYDLYLNLFQGVPPFQPFTGEQFYVPLYWITISLLIVYTVSGYASDDFHGFGHVRILYSGDRNAWITGKIIWMIVQVLTDFFMILFGCVIYACVKGFPFHLSINQPFWEMVNPDLAHRSTESYIIVTILLPVLAFCTIAALELLLSVVLKPAVAVFVGCMILVISAFTDEVFLIGNHAMWIRMGDFTENGLEKLPCFILDVMIIMASLWLFREYVQKKDLLPIENES